MYLAGEAVAPDTVDTLGPGEEEGDTAVVPAGKGMAVGPEGTPGVVGGRQGPATGLDRQAAWGSLHHRHSLLWARLRGEGSTSQNGNSELGLVSSAKLVYITKPL